MDGLDSRFAGGDVELAYTEWLGASPPVVFLHGLSGSRAVWLPHADLRGQQRAFAFDARGHGDSGRAPTYRWTEFGTDAIGFVENVCKEPALLVGNSLGAMTAIYVAATRPDIVKGILLVDPPLYAHEGLRDEREAFEQRRTMAGKHVDELVELGLPNQVALAVSTFDGNAVGAVLDGDAFDGWDTDALLARIHCPVLLEHGERNVMLGTSASAIYEGELDRAVALIGDCTVAEIKGSGHIPMMQQPGEFRRLVRAFIDRMVS